ncbi:MAG: DNA cytosine methyltransferase, partial [Streptococcaceae bacterium]|jgi:DNA (cytosine-5)-methyltransferase 1|nr:DNA cytosine methyltransferase [Streptococcaceae bacterium]
MDEKFGGADSFDSSLLRDVHDFDEYIYSDGLFARQFPIEQSPYKKGRQFSEELSNIDVHSEDYIVDISDNFTGTIWNTGIMRYGQYFTIDTAPIIEKPITLGEIVEQAKEAYIADFGEKAYEEYINSYIITDEAKLEKFHYLRGPKKIPRTTPDGHEWIYSEGGMSPYDDLSLPARTMLTSEGSVNRSTHFLKIGDNYRLITPIEAELLQDFPANWTKTKLNKDGVPIQVTDRMRMFFMGNALVTGIVCRIGVELGVLVSDEVKSLVKA